MKIISGKYKGRILEGFDIQGTRPTMDRVKESLFATIQNKIDESTVLDLFSGSGNLGLEALSQGALKIYLVDHNHRAIKTIQKNIEKLKISENEVEILEKDYQEALRILKEKQVKFDLIFLDPPYQTDLIERALVRIKEYQLLKENGYIICESDTEEKIKYEGLYQNVKQKKYGDKYVVILQEL